MKLVSAISLALYVSVLAGCTTETTQPTAEQPLIVVPAGFPVQSFPSDNQPTAERIALGKKLFFDPILSADNTVSCASCHQPEHAFADVVAVSPGVGGRLGTRNAPSLLNIGYHPYFMREGGVPTLEQQVLAPIQEHSEMDFDILLIAERLNEDAEYVKMSQSAYHRQPDAFVITRALASFERTLVSGNSKYDHSTQYSPQSALYEVLSDDEKKGRDLFLGDRASCSSCHGGFLFTDHSFKNNGLYLNYADRGRARLTSKAEDEALFKVPSLRNVAHTAPYMHDGSVKTLRDVVTHYNTGGFGHAHKSTLVRPLGLTETEIDDLVAFLSTLSEQQ